MKGNTKSQDTVAIERYWGNEPGKKEGIVGEGIVTEDERGLVNLFNV